MGVDLKIVTTTRHNEDRAWLADGQHHLTMPVTLDYSAFVQANHYPDGYIPSGVVLGKITATGLYKAYDNGAADGSETAAGILYSSVDVSSAADVGAPMLIHGFVVEASLPDAGTMTNGGIDSSGKTDLKLVHFR